MVTELERLRKELKEIKEIREIKNPECKKCKKICTGDFYRCMQHGTTFCTQCVLNPVRNHLGNIMYEDQANCSEHMLYRKDCNYERVKQETKNGN
jgi:hypothetical protein